MVSYLRIDPDGVTVLGEIHQAAPLSAYNTRARSANNGKPFILKAKVKDVVPDPATQVREGPTYNLFSTRADIIYSLRAKTAEELSRENTAAVDTARHRQVDLPSMILLGGLAQAVKAILGGDAPDARSLAIVDKLAAAATNHPEG